MFSFQQKFCKNSRCWGSIQFSPCDTGGRKEKTLFIKSSASIEYLKWIQIWNQKTERQNRLCMKNLTRSFHIETDHQLS